MPSPNRNSAEKQFLIKESWVLVRAPPRPSQFVQLIPCRGTTPSDSYNIIRAVQGKVYTFSEKRFKKILKVDNNTITPLRKPNKDLLSESDIECLIEAIAETEKLSFSQRKAKSHDKGYKASDSHFMSIEDFCKNLKNGDEVLEYLNSMYQIE